MNVSTGNPHLLVFERDQQVTTLLISEFELAGYECHAARTAVEVFDTIARHPVRLVLVNLAQAAASRREFWVALDAQRRGRGVQVLTYRCMNLAGYGPEDPDERGRWAHADIEVDGMLGIMNLVDTVRMRIPVSTTGSQVASAPAANGQAADAPEVAEVTEAPQVTPAIAKSATVPLAAGTPNGALAELASSSTQPRQQPPANALPVSPPQAPAPPAPPMGPASSTAPVYGNRIRAIIYPGKGAWSPPGTLNSPGSGAQSAYSSSPIAETPNPAFRTFNRQAGVAGQTRQQAPLRTQWSPDTLGASSSVTQPAPSEQGEESGLAQLSRMLREQRTPIQEDVVQEAKQDSRERPVMLSRVASSQHPSTSMPSVKVSPSSPSAPSASPPPQTMAPVYPDQNSSSVVDDRFNESAGKAHDNDAIPLEQVRTNLQDVLRRREVATSVASDNTLLDIMQSLPPMSSPPPLVLSGRATRSLGSVLLEGHLVPQNRLEVAQSVQRMLRGVDLNYQLGEILLMFKLLTPDQLLAASLVSYGLISTAQISTLGRIRQELHAIGLEYDLENLLILFRILTPEQLREVRASWS